jgi:hypothetical protein
MKRKHGLQVDAPDLKALAKKYGASDNDLSNVIDIAQRSIAPAIVK